MAAPGGVTGLAGAGQATFTWTSPPSDCSGPATAYAIYLYGQDGSQQIQVAVAAAYAFSGVSPGVYYTATVTAWDGQRWSAWSQWAPWVLGG